MSSRTIVRQKLLEALTASPFKLRQRPWRETLAPAGSTGADQPGIAGEACVFDAPEIRAAGELDLAPDLLTLDEGLGSLGLVHVIEPGESESGKAAAEISAAATRHVDQANYLRHLLITRGVSAGPEAFPLDYTVEVVLIIPAIPENLCHAITETVREMASKTRFLQATGLNLLQFGTPPDYFDREELVRAFAWLLSATRQRLSARKAPPPARLDGLELFHYRLPGQRPWMLRSNRVHLLHGPNGTGKSSIAEALELAVTGKVERFATNPASDYDAIIRNSQSKAPATISLTLSTGPRRFTVVKKGVSETPLQQDLPVTAFRLDQTVMDQLIRANSQQRARVLTRAFFPGKAYDELEEAQKKFDAAFLDLPGEVRNEIKSLKRDPNDWPAALVPRLEWIKAPAIPSERIEDFLPLKREHLETLAGIVPEIGGHLQSLQTQTDLDAFKKTLDGLEESLGRIRSNARAYRDAVVESLDVLGRLKDWAPAPVEVTLAYPDLLRVWTDRLALGNLLQKHLEISRTVLDARAKGWAPRDSESFGLFSDSADALKQGIEGLVRAAKECDEEERDASDQLQSAGGKTVPGDNRRPQGSLSESQIKCLNLTGGWFARQRKISSDAQLGDAIQDAVTGNKKKPRSFGTIKIGEKDWFQAPVDFLAPLMPALDALLAFEQATGQPRSPSAADEPPVYRGPAVRMHSFETALEAAQTVAEKYGKVETTLMARLAEIGGALDEIITLFTPARWAYEGLKLDTKLSDGKVGVELVTSRTKSQADMRLNTAELNLVVLALYLLCGPAIGNPLGAIILDDPLQNMDDLTTATVARGVAKIAALLPEGWRLIFMFHDEEDLETFRREVPGSVYYLQWLGPIGAVNPNQEEVLHDATLTRPAKRESLGEVILPHPLPPEVRNRLGATRTAQA